MSFWTSPMVAAIRAVAVPMMATTVSVGGAWMKSAALRPIMYTPAVTIVAAWMSARHRRRALHRVGQPDEQRNLRGLTGRADEQQQGNQRKRAERGLRRQPGDGAGISWKSTVPKRTNTSRTPSTKPKSPMRLTMNAFLPASAADFFVKAEADQQVRAEAHAFPADEHHQEVRAEDEHEHERGEQVQVGEVAGELGVALLVHVGRRVDMDQRSDAGDHQDHDRRQRVDPQGERHREVARRDPREDALDDRPRLGLQRRQPPHDDRRDEERPEHRRAGDGARGRLAETPAEAGVHQEAEER